MPQLHVQPHYTKTYIASRAIKACKVALFIIGYVLLSTVVFSLAKT